MLIDCGTCPGRAVACDGCIVALLTADDTCSNSGNAIELTVAERPDDDRELAEAINVFGRAGMLTDKAIAALDFIESAGDDRVGGSSGWSLRAV